MNKDKELLKNLSAVVAELFNCIADITEGVPFFVIQEKMKKIGECLKENVLDKIED